MLQRILHEEDGSAITEFSIMLPALLMLMFYSIFFGDLLEVKLKTLEAARYATWESTVYRNATSVTAEIEKRFANLKSVDLGEAETIHLIGVDDLVIQVTYTDQLTVDMTGGVPQNNSVPGGSGSGGAKLGGVDQAINTVISWAKLPTIGKARTDITFTVGNKIVPEMLLLNTQIKAESTESQSFGSNSFEFKSHHVLVYDTWKGWPNKNRRIGAKNGNTANPMQTYAIAEQAMVDQVQQIAFFKLASFSIVDTIGGVFDFFGLPNPLAYKANPGPTSLLPVEVSGNGVQSFSPSSGKKNTRFGHRLESGVVLGDNPKPGIDHSRYTLPYTISKGASVTWWHGQSGGYGSGTQLKTHQYQNDYYKSYQCRGHYYDGYITQSGKPGASSNYNGCNGNADSSTSLPSIGSLF